MGFKGNVMVGFIILSYNVEYRSIKYTTLMWKGKLQAYAHILNKKTCTS